VTDLAVAALTRKRAELAGEIEAGLARISRQRAELIHLDAVIRLLDPAAEPEAVRPKIPRNNGCDWFGRGELARMAFDALRGAQKLLSAVDIARFVLSRKGMELGDVVALRRVKNMIDAALRRREGGLVERVVYGPRSVGWRIGNGREALAGDGPFRAV
jgi:hypothetical protein